MLDVLTGSVIVQSIGMALLHFIWQGTLVGLFTAIVLRSMAPQAATSRYLVGCGALLLLFALPVWTAVERKTNSALVTSPSSRGTGLATATDERQGRPASILHPRQSPDLTGIRLLSPITGSREQWIPAAVFVWLAGVTVLSLRLILSWYWAARLCVRDTQMATSAWRRQVVAMSRRLNISRPVRVLESARARVPAVVGWARPVLLLPVATLAGLTPGQVEAVLAHELAHVRRHDYLVNALQSIIETVLFYHPAVWWVSAQVRQEREHCCDDIAVAVCGDPILYGRALADLEEGRLVGGAAVLAANGGSLSTRVRRLVGAPTRERSAPMANVLAVVAGALSLVAVAYASDTAAPTEPPTVAREQTHTPAPAVPPLPSPSPPAQGDQVPVTPTPPTPPVPPPNRDATGNLEVQPPSPPRAPAPPTPTPRRTEPAPPVPLLPRLPPVPPVPPGPPRQDAMRIESTVDGVSNSVELRADWERDLAELATLPLAPGDHLTLSRGSEHVALAAVADGTVQRLYYSDGQPERFGRMSETILGGVLSTLIRNGGVGVERRVARVLDQAGVDGVLEEIGQITETLEPSLHDAFAYRYFAALFDMAVMTDRETARVLAQTAQQVRSEYDRALILMQQERRAETGPLVRDAFFSATSTITSDHEMRLVLTELVDSGPVSNALLRATLDAAGGLETDEERARLLTDIAETQSLAPPDTDPETRSLFFERLDGMQSNVERAGVLTAIASHATDTATRAAVVKSTARLNSDAHKRRVLRAIAATRLEAPISGPFFVAAGSIHSDHEKRRALAGIADLDAPAPAALGETLRLATEIQTDHELASLLVRIAERHTLDSQLRTAYLDAVDTIASPFAQRQTLAALARR